ncbi:MAG: hypothetical protein WAU86_12655, partial [Oricola sp.]
LRAFGPYLKRTTDDLVAMAARHDLVWASARCAMESSIAGAGVIVCDPRGLAGFLTRRTWQEWQDHNLGLGCLDEKPTFGALSRVLSDYDPDEAFDTARQLRRERDLESGLDAIEALYRSVIENPAAQRRDEAPVQ